MAIRPIDQKAPAAPPPRVDKTPVAAPQGPSLAELQADLAAMTAPGPGRSAMLSEAEVASLMERAKGLAGPDQKSLIKQVSTGIQDGSIQVGKGALEKFAALAGLAPAILRAPVQARLQAESGTEQRDMRQGLKAHVEQVTGSQAEATRNAMHEGIHKSHAGAAIAKNELTPEYKAAKELAGALTSQLYGQVDARLAAKAPGAKVFLDTVSPHLAGMAESTISTFARDPAATARLKTTLQTLGKAGAVAATGESLKDLGKAVEQATGVAAMNPEALQIALENAPALVARIAPQYAEKVAHAAKAVGTKLGLAEKIAARGAASAAVHVGADVAKAAGAATAKGAAGAAVHGAVAAGKTGGKVLPVVGNVISVGSTIYAATGFVKQLFTRPFHPERVVKEGLNTLAQGVGIAFPWVALGGDLANMGWSAKIAHSDKKKIEAGTLAPEQSALKDLAPWIDGGADALMAACKGGGRDDLATRVSELRAQAAKISGHEGPIPGQDLADFKKKQEQFLTDLGQTSQAELEKAAATQHGPQKEAVLQLAAAFGEMGRVVYKNKRMSERAKMPGNEQKPDDEKTARGEMGGELLSLLSRAATAGAALLAARQQAGPAAPGAPA